MNRADRMLAVLADGQPYSRHEIFAQAGYFFLTNNAAAELRARGLDVVQHREGDEFIYQLISLRSPEAYDRLGPGSSGERSERREASDSTGDTAPEIEPSTFSKPLRSSPFEPEQLRFEVAA